MISSRLTVQIARLSGIIGLFLLGVFPLESAPGSAHAQSGSQTLSGYFTTVWADPAPGSHVPGKTQYFLGQETGQNLELNVSETLLESAGGVLALNGQPVTVTVAEPPPGGAPAGSLVQVTSIKPTATSTSSNANGAPSAASAASVGGAVPYAAVLCKFQDQSIEPVPPSYISGLLSNSYPGLDHYWREISYNKINLAGSAVYGWFTLPHPQSYYWTSNGTNTPLLLNECAGAAISQGVNFGPYAGIMTMYNDVLNPNYNYSYGGQNYTKIGGITKLWRVTWMAQWGYENQAVLAHESGHSLSFPHSNFYAGAGDTDTYDNDWDVMSNTWGEYLGYSDTYGVIGQGAITPYLFSDGWILPAQRFVVPTSGSYSVTLERTDQPTNSTSYRMLQIPVPGSSTMYYTVEARKRVGYDAGLPGDAVIIHQVDTKHWPPAWLMAAPGVTVSTDPGAMWTPGETFSAANFSLHVDSDTGTGYVVTVTRHEPPAKLTAIAPTATIPTKTPLFRWNASSTATSYRLVVKTGSTVVAAPTYTSAAASCGATCQVTAGPFGDGVYTFTVQPSNAYGSGPISAALKFTVDTIAPVVPLNSSPKPGATYAKPIAKLKVKSSKGATLYDFILSRLPDMSSPTLGSYKKGSLAFNLGLNFGEYWFNARATDAAGNQSGYSMPTSFIYTLMSSPKRGQILKTGKMKFSWKAYAPTAGYDLAFSQNAAFNPNAPGAGDTVLSLGNVRSYNTRLVPLAPGPWYWTVRVNGSVWMPVQTFTVAGP